MIDPIVAVPWAGGLTICTGPASPMSFAWTSTSTVWPELITLSSSTAIGKISTETVPVSQAGGAKSSQPWIVKLSRPVNVPDGVYVNEPSAAMDAVPWAGALEIDRVTVWPVSGSVTTTAPETAAVAPVVTAASLTVGAVLP